MIKNLFVCYGNICRSPMAEFIMKAAVRAAGLEARFQVDSAAVSREEIGNIEIAITHRDIVEDWFVEGESTHICE